MFRRFFAESNCMSDEYVFFTFQNAGILKISEK